MSAKNDCPITGLITTEEAGYTPTMYLGRDTCRRLEIMQLWINKETGKRVWRNIPSTNKYII